MTWLVIGIIAWLACGFIGAGRENAEMCARFCLDDGDESDRLVIQHIRKGVLACAICGPLGCVGNWKHGWHAPWRTP